MSQVRATLSMLLPLVESITKVLAIVLAGAWAYYHYFRGRTYRSRLEMAVSGEIFSFHEADYMIGTVRIKNVGLSRVALEQKGTGLRVSSCDVTQEDFAVIEWTVGRVFETFLHHAWIEPGESLEERTLTKVPSGKLAVRLELRVVCSSHEWNTETVIHRSSEDAYDRNLSLVRQLQEAKLSRDTQLYTRR